MQKMSAPLCRALFTEGEVINSGGSSERVNAARLEKIAIEDEFMRYRSLKSKSRNKFRYSYIDIVLSGFERIDPKSIQPSIQQLFIDAGLPKNYSTENYVYGFAKEIRRRLLQDFFLSSGEIIDDRELASNATAGVLQPLVEGARLQVLVDRRERNPEAVRVCKEIPWRKLLRM